MDGENGEWIEEVFIGTGEFFWNVRDWYEVDEEKSGVDSREKGRHIKGAICYS